jgi:hypothetical protein
VGCSGDFAGQFVVQALDPVQDMAVPVFAVGRYAFAKKFLAGFIENYAFGFRAAEIYANAKHASIRGRRRSPNSIK